MNSPAGQTAALLSSVANGRFTLFLQHLPVVVAQTEGLFDLQLSGHTHRGQIFPFRLLTGLLYPKQTGFILGARLKTLHQSRFRNLGATNARPFPARSHHHRVDTPHR